MEMMYPSAAGLDVHKKLIVACVRVAQKGRIVRKKERFATTTADLIRMSDWMASFGVTCVAMEATGVYWKPVWHILDGSFELTLANAQHVKVVPGRKSDMNDAEWLAELLAHGLIRPSFIAPQPIQELRDLTRTRKQLSRNRSQQALRIQKVIEDANIKLSSFVSDILGVASRNIIEAIVAGQTDPDQLAALRGQLKVPHEDLVESLRGRITDNHRFLLRIHLDQVDSINHSIAAIDVRLANLLAPFQDRLDRLVEIPGVSQVIARVIIAEIGMDMSHFATAGHLVSWAGLGPRLDESAGKPRSKRIRKGNPWLKVDLTQAALATRRSKKSYLCAQFHRIAARRGSKKAVIAVAALILTAVYFILRDGAHYHDLGPDHFDRRNAGKTARRLPKRIESLGYKVDLHPVAA